MGTKAGAKKGFLVIIDDDAEMRSLLEDYFCEAEYQTKTYRLASEALEALLEQPQEFEKLDLILSDIRMPGLSGIEFVQKIKPHYPSVPIILITAFGTIENAISAIRLGAYDYLVKPFKLAELGVTAERAVEYRRLQLSTRATKSPRTSKTLNTMVGKSSAMRAVLDLISRIANASANVLISGESGTGKELVARGIHESSDRCDKPFIAVNCSAIPEGLLESELFGHAKGAFTGAIQKKVGLFEEANGGTIFLDEIGDMPLSLQAKLLRVLQERKIRPVGENEFKNIDVRVIAATHRDLKSEIRKGTFREDLYYRLSVIPIGIPPLRERREDIPLLADFFLTKYATQNQAPARHFREEAMQLLLKRPWKGNVRELENVIERAVVLSQSEWIEEDVIPFEDELEAEEFFDHITKGLPSIEEIEKKYIQIVLKKTQGRKDKAADILGINRRTLYRKEREYGLVEEPEL